jgi:hypothetical protein
MSKAEEAKTVTAIVASKWPQIVAALAGKGFVSEKFSVQVCEKHFLYVLHNLLELNHTKNDQNNVLQG